MWIEKLDDNPTELIPEELRQAGEGGGIKIDLDRPMSETLAILDKYPVSTRVSLSGTIIVGRDIAHAKWKERYDRGEGIPEYIKNHPVLYAGPPRPRKACPAARWARRLPTAWTPMWICSRAWAAAW